MLQLTQEFLLERCSSAHDTLKCLRSVDITTLAAANLNIAYNAFYGTWVFVPVVDGTFIKQRPTVALKQLKKLNGVCKISWLFCVKKLT